METEAALAALEQEGLQEPNEPVEARAFAEGKKEMPDDEEEPWERWDEMPIPEAAEMDDRPKVPSPKVRWPKEPGQAWPLPASCAVGVLSKALLRPLPLSARVPEFNSVGVGTF
ncbi:unnamed protein product [Durusdinium trenchii]|uniref:Uncharacterized protein n=1 Tax=Durusdinium trenchii TaxID=1381693 RepID=A0ABP0MIS9_9DINO